MSIATDASGNVYVADALANRVQKFDASGTFLAAWGSTGTANGQFEGVLGMTLGIATDASGNVYVADGGNRRVQKFDTSGSFLTTWGSYGSGGGEFLEPVGVATDGNGNVYVADSGGNSIQKFDANGTFLGRWGSDRLGGEFDGPSSVATDESGNVYVSDAGNSRIQKFNATGTFLTAWGSFGAANGQFQGPSGIATDATGHVYVVDHGNARIQKFGTSGGFLTAWGSFGSAAGQFEYPCGIATDASGNIYVADLGNDRIQKFDASGTFLTTWGGYPQFGLGPCGVATDGSGHVYVTRVADRFGMNGASLVYTFDGSGTLLTGWGGYGSGDGQFVNTTAVATDGSGHVYVADGEVYGFNTGSIPIRDDRIEQFDARGVFLGTWGSYGSGDGEFVEPIGVATDASGNVYVADTGNNRIQKFACP